MTLVVHCSNFWELLRSNINFLIFKLYTFRRPTIVVWPFSDQRFMEFLAQNSWRTIFFHKRWYSNIGFGRFQHLRQKQSDNRNINFVLEMQSLKHLISRTRKVTSVKIKLATPCQNSGVSPTEQPSWWLVLKILHGINSMKTEHWALVELKFYEHPHGNPLLHKREERVHNVRPSTTHCLWSKHIKAKGKRRDGGVCRERWHVCCSYYYFVGTIPIVIDARSQQQVGSIGIESLNRV